MVWFIILSYDFISEFTNFMFVENMLAIYSYSYDSAFLLSKKKKKKRMEITYTLLRCLKISFD